ncbi:MAG: TetR family transcriptional regulator [Alphaproteobacteria bacterium]|nr:TetR family transcriptional regulator [Alphaproteobacteria bacterium]
MVRRTKEEAEKTREALLDAAEFVFLEKGVANASLEDIARSAGVTRGAVYWHFENKLALFDAMHERVKLPMDELFERAMHDGDSFTALKEVCITVMRHLAEDARAKRVFTILLLKCEETCPAQSNVERQQQKRDKVIQRFEKIFTAAHQDGKLGPDTSPQTAAIALHATICGVLNDYVRNPEVLDIATLGPQLIEIFFRGISA